jgi:hypothetical protein
MVVLQHCAVKEAKAQKHTEAFTRKKTLMGQAVRITVYEINGGVLAYTDRVAYKA